MGVTVAADDRADWDESIKGNSFDCASDEVVLLVVGRQRYHRHHQPSKRESRTDKARR